MNNANETAVRKRGWIKNIAIIFLVILLLLTFFSNTIMTYSLPEVSAQYGQYSSLSSSVKLKGNVKANESYKVVYEPTDKDSVVQSRKVKSVYVREGDYVSKDQEIIVLEGGASEELKSLQDQYDSLKNQYDLALSGDNVSYLQNAQQLESAQKRYDDAKEEYDRLNAKYAEAMNGAEDETEKDKRAEEIKAERKKLSAEIASLEEKIAGLQSKLDAAKGLVGDDGAVGNLATEERKFAEIEKQYLALKEKEEKMSAMLSELNKSVDEMRQANELTATINSLTSANKELDKSISENDKLIKEAIEKLRILNPDKKDKQVDELLVSDLKLFEEENELAKLEKDVAELNAEIEKLKEEGKSTENEKEKLDEKLNKLSNKRTDVDGMRQANELTNTIKSLQDANSQLNSSKEDNNKKISDIKQKLEIIGQNEVTDINLFGNENNLSKYEEEYSSASSALADYAPYYEEAKSKIEALRKSSSASEEIEEYTKLIEMYTTQLDERKKSYEDTLDVDELTTALQTAEDNMKNEKSSLDILRAQTNQSNTSTNLDRKEQKKQLAELSEKIEKYKNAPETLSVTAPISGRVVSIYCVPGDSVSSGSTVADIEIADKGYTCEVTVSSEEARKIAVGSPVTISNSWWYSNVEASIVQIRSDVQSQGKNKIVIFEVKGDVYEGQELSFSVGDRSASYDNVFPNSALHDDNEGKYVLVVDAKKTPLGMRYKARRVQVEVVASDDTQSSISGLMGGEFVITNATTPIADGQMVRLAEN